MKNSRSLIVFEDAQIVGHAKADVYSRMHVLVPASGLTQNILPPGGKCCHGVYIPANFLPGDYAPYCSLCFPYEIVAKKNAIFKA